jgi:hypothetical protein
MVRSLQMACNLAGSWNLLKNNLPLSLSVEASMKINAFSYFKTTRRSEDALRESYVISDFRGTRSEQDATYAFGHVYNHCHGYLSLLRSTFQITNSTTGRIDGLRALQRRAALERRRKVAVLYPEGTRYRCSLGSITRFAPREATVTRRPLRIRATFLVRGLPLNKKTNKKTSGRLGTDGVGSYGRAARRTVSPSATDLRAPVRYAHWAAGERIAASPGTPERNKAEPIHSRDSTIGAYKGRVKDAILGHDL